MDLPFIWFLIIAVLWTGFFVLEGFDFGVGVLHWFVGKDETERRVAINSIGPFWDGNEVWLIVGGAAIFAAFPAWYATMFSSLYLALVLILVALIIRGLSFEYRGKGKTQRWRTAWSWGLVISSALAPLLLGVGLGDLLVGLPIGADEQYAGTFFDLLTPYGLLTGVAFLVFCIMHGATFLALKTTDEVRARSHRIAQVSSIVVIVLAAIWAVSTYLVAPDPSALVVVFLVVAVIGLLATVSMLRAHRDGWAFIASAVAIGSVAATLFSALYPNVMNSSLDPEYSLTVAGSASGDYALTVMTIVAVVMMPIVLLYQGWTYYSFRKRVTAPPAGPESVEASAEPSNT